MRYLIPEAEAQYMDSYHGQFSKKLAEYAFSLMRNADGPIRPHSIEEMQAFMRQNSITIPEHEIYTAWYLYNMAFADYPETLDTDRRRVTFVSETLRDPDTSSEAVLACFRAKMDIAGIPIHWERML